MLYEAWTAHLPHPHVRRTLRKDSSVWLYYAIEMRLGEITNVIEIGVRRPDFSHRLPYKISISRVRFAFPGA